MAAENPYSPYGRWQCNLGKKDIYWSLCTVRKALKQLCKSTSQYSGNEQWCIGVKTGFHCCCWLRLSFRKWLFSSWSDWFVQSLTVVSIVNYPDSQCQNSQNIPLDDKWLKFKHMVINFLSIVWLFAVAHSLQNITFSRALHVICFKKNLKRGAVELLCFVDFRSFSLC